MQSFLIWLIQQLFPQRCCSCRKLSEQVICYACKSELYLDPKWVSRGEMDIYTLYDYAQRGIPLVLKQWKYTRKQQASALLLQETDLDELGHYDSVVPVPMHKKREVERGENHAELLAKEITEKLGLACKKSLKRIKATQQQAKLNKQERKNNLKKAFVVKDDVKGKYILLVDDIVSTGTTLLACKKVLEDAGAAQVDAFCLARNQKNSL